MSLEEDTTAARLLRLVGRGKRVLELGCSVGAQSRVMTQQLDCQVIGVEINRDAAVAAGKYCKRVIVANLDKIDLASELNEERFDVILCADVLEHLADPLRTLLSAKSLLVENGRLILSVPNVAHAALVFELAHGRFDYRSRGLLDDTHIRFFTRTNLIRSASEANMLIEHLERISAIPESTEFTVSPRNVAEQSLMDYIVSHSPEAFTYQFIAVLRPSSMGQQETHLANSQFESVNLAEHQRASFSHVSRSTTRLNDLYAVYPRSHSELQWIKTKKFFQVASALSAALHRFRTHVRNGFRPQPKKH
ncbi:MAG TPA: class I SAM-dependent methyltransferase [Burkholderiaceae bacterium]|nr:class I SAM-dependent methyltransferase [Burkholderiaceae bacterium]